MKTTEVFQGYTRFSKDNKTAKDDDSNNNRNEVKDNMKHVNMHDDDNNQNDKQKKLQEIERQLSKLFADVSSIMGTVKHELSK